MRVTSKGQVTIPKHLRRRTDIGPGSDVDFAEADGEIVIRKARHAATGAGSLEAYLDGVTGIVDPGMSTDAFMRLLRDE